MRTEFSIADGIEKIALQAIDPKQKFSTSAV